MAKKEIDRRFAKFGTVSFTGTSKVNDFIDYLEQGRVMGTQCKKCNQIFFPPRADCFNCLSSEIDWFEIQGTGILKSYSRLQYGPLGFEEDVPYSVAVVDYGDYKVFGRIADEIPIEQVEIGMRLFVVVNKIQNDQLNFVFKKED